MGTALYLMRHAYDDFDKERSLGREQARAAGAYLSSTGLDPLRTLIIASESSRAIRTAEIVKEATGVEHMITRDALTIQKGGQTFLFLSDMLKIQARSFDAIIAVTHQPNMEVVLRAFAALCSVATLVSTPNGVIFYILPDEKIFKCVHPPDGVE